ncbi:hypothetical protein ABW21_db0208757 [Orbilia brochopaga]|nr:hypothetical protein ABW21_db0208757 [Drechslerella brochopaga]
MDAKGQKAAMDAIDEVIKKEVAASDIQAQLAWNTKLEEEGESVNDSAQLKESAKASSGASKASAAGMPNETDPAAPAGGAAASIQTATSPATPQKSFRAMRQRLLDDETESFCARVRALDNIPAFRSLSKKKKIMRINELKLQVKAERQVNIRALKAQFGIPFRSPRKPGSLNKSSDSGDWSEVSDYDVMISIPEPNPPTPKKAIAASAESSLNAANLPEKTRPHNRGKPAAKRRRFAPIDFEAVPKASQDSSSEEVTSPRRSGRSRTSDNHVHASAGANNQSDATQHQLHASQNISEAAPRGVKRPHADVSADGDSDNGSSLAADQPADETEDAVTSPRRSGRSHKAPKLFEDIYGNTTSAPPVTIANLKETTKKFLEDTAALVAANKAANAGAKWSRSPTPSPKRRVRPPSDAMRYRDSQSPTPSNATDRFDELIELAAQDGDGGYYDDLESRIPEQEQRITDQEEMNTLYDTVDQDDSEAKQSWKLPTGLFQEFFKTFSWNRRPE